jgi:hypothetical protein
MVHAGYEASAVIGGNKKFGDTWKMFTWTMSGRMGGLLKVKPAKANRNGHSNGHAKPQPRPAVAAPAAGQGDEVFRIL